jgi:tripartite ATP-independent transporter DctM subunit
MSPVTIGIIAFAAILVILILGVSVPSTMCILGFGGMLLLMNPTGAILKMGLTPYETLNSYTYAVMPMFIFMAQVIANTGVGEALYTAFYRIVGRFSGGLAMATIIACGIFAAISASTVATALTIGMIALPEMRKHGYSDSLSTGSIAAGGTLGVMIPPSRILIFYGIMTNQNIAKLFVAGVIPGILTIIVFCLITWIICKKDPKAGPPAPKFTPREMLSGLTGCIDIVILIVFVLGGMFVGWFTPTESGAIGAAGAVILTLIRKRLTIKGFGKAIAGTMENTGMLYFILIGGQTVNYFMSMTGLPSLLAKTIIAMHLPGLVVIIAIIVIYLFLGCFLDGLCMILLTIPVLYPIVLSLGMDPIWFGIVATFCLQMAVLTPSVGMNVYVIKRLGQQNADRDGIQGHLPVSGRPTDSGVDTNRLSNDSHLPA